MLKSFKADKTVTYIFLLPEANKGIEEQKMEELKRKYEEVVAQKQELNAKYMVLQSKIQNPDSSLPVSEALSPQNLANIAKALGGSPHHPGPPPPPPMAGDYPLF